MPAHALTKTKDLDIGDTVVVRQWRDRDGVVQNGTFTITLKAAPAYGEDCDCTDLEGELCIFYGSAYDEATPLNGCAGYATWHAEKQQWEDGEM